MPCVPQRLYDECEGHVKEVICRLGQLPNGAKTREMANAHHTLTICAFQGNRCAHACIVCVYLDACAHPHADHLRHPRQQVHTCMCVPWCMCAWCMCVCAHTIQAQLVCLHMFGHMCMLT